MNSIRKRLEEVAPGPSRRARKLGSRYEKLRRQFHKAGGDPRKSSEAHDAMDKMRDIEADLYEHWYPYRYILGSCWGCEEGLVPAVKDGVEGLGCQHCRQFYPEGTAPVGVFGPTAKKA